MFKNRKRPKKASLRQRKTDEHDNDDNDDETRRNLEQAVRATKKLKTTANDDNDDDNNNESTSVMHHYQTSQEQQVSAADLATSTAQHHPTTNPITNEKTAASNAAERGDDGIFRDKTRNKFLAGPIRASTFVRTTCRFDYQPDICKDYKDTGFCGFGDTCIYLHDRGDTLTGWQLEQQWEEQRKKDMQQREMDAFAASSSSDGGKSFSTQQEAASTAGGNNNPNEGLPFACHLCRNAFTDPVVTSCGHYFCQKCIMDHVRQNEKGTCPICNKDAHGVFNQPTKLLMKKRRLLSSKATWQEFADACSNAQSTANKK